MSKKTGKALWTVFILICFGILILLTIFDKLPKNLNAKKIITIFSLSTTLVIYGYNHWKFLFVFWRKVCANFWGDTVSWTGKYILYFKPNQDFTKIMKTFKSGIVEESSFECLPHSEIQDDSAVFKLKKGGLKSSVNIYRNTANDYDKVLLEYTSSTSYRDSKKQVEAFRQLIKKLSDVTPQQANLSVFPDLRGLKSLLSVEISMAKYNPFYRLTLRHFDDEEESIKWNMVLKQKNGLKVEVKEHVLKVTSPNVEDVLVVLKNYIALSTVG